MNLIALSVNWSVLILFRYLYLYWFVLNFNLPSTTSNHCEHSLFAVYIGQYIFQSVHFTCAMRRILGSKSKCKFISVLSMVKYNEYYLFATENVRKKKQTNKTSSWELPKIFHKYFFQSSSIKQNLAQPKMY